MTDQQTENNANIGKQTDVSQEAVDKNEVKTAPNQKNLGQKPKQMPATVKQDIAVKDDAITKLYQNNGLAQGKNGGRQNVEAGAENPQTKPAEASSTQQENKLVREEAKINRVGVSIAGGDYTICGWETEEHLRGIAAIVDNKMSDLRRQYSKQSINRLAVLTALQLADEFVKLSDEYDSLILKLEKLTAKLEEQNKK